MGHPQPISSISHQWRGRGYPSSGCSKVPPSQGTDVVQHQLDALGYTLHGLNHPGVPVSPAVNQYHLSQAAFGLPIDEDESGEGSDTSEPCEALDLSIHGRPCPQAPEWPVQEEGGQDATEVLDLSIHGRPRPRTPSGLFKGKVAKMSQALKLEGWWCQLLFTCVRMTSFRIYKILQMRPKQRCRSVSPSIPPTDNTPDNKVDDIEFHTCLCL